MLRVDDGLGLPDASVFIVARGEARSFLRIHGDDLFTHESSR